MKRSLSNPDVLRVAALSRDLRILLGGLRRKLREQVQLGELSWSQTAVLGHLERDGAATIGSLAKAEGVRPQSMGATVAALEQAGLVKGMTDPQDGRRTVLALTAAARDLIKAKRAAREDWLARSIRTRLTPADQKKLAVAVELLGRLVD